MVAVLFDCSVVIMIDIMMLPNSLLSNSVNEQYIIFLLYGKHLNSLIEIYILYPVFRRRLKVEVEHL